MFIRDVWLTGGFASAVLKTLARFQKNYNYFSSLCRLCGAKYGILRSNFELIVFKSDSNG